MARGPCWERKIDDVGRTGDDDCDVKIGNENCIYKRVEVERGVERK